MDRELASRLGRTSAITIFSQDLSASLYYYQKLGFTEVTRNSFPFPWIQISDGALLIMLRLGMTPFCSLTYFTHNLDAIVAELENEGITFIVRPKETDQVRRFLFKSPDGLNISLITSVESFEQPRGHTALTLAQKDFSDPSTYPNQACGIFGEFAHPVKDLNMAIDFWKGIGFTSVSRYETPYPWAIVHDGLSIIGLHQTASFDYPVITYFAADQSEKIEQLKLKNIMNYTDLGQGRMVLETPDQQRINLFPLGM